MALRIPLHCKDLCFFVTVGRLGVRAPDSGRLTCVNSVQHHSCQHNATILAKNIVGYVRRARPAYHGQSTSWLKSEPVDYTLLAVGLLNGGSRMCRVVNLEAGDLRTAIRLKDSATGSSPIYATNSNYRKRKFRIVSIGNRNPHSRMSAVPAGPEAPRLNS